jgi:hypothetical protein
MQGILVWPLRTRLDPRFAGLLGEPRFKALMQRIEKRTETQRLNVLAQERKLERPKKQ